MTTRVSITDLKPGTNFGVQVRARGEGTASGWSTRYEFTTDLDLVVPGNVTGATWLVSGNSFHAEWDAVTTNLNGYAVPITRYEIELVASATTRMVSVTPITGVKPVYDLSFEGNRALFGTPQPTVTFRVRAVDNKNLKGAWTSVISASNPAPATPTSLVMTPGVDQISLSWTGVADTDLTGYTVYVGTTAGFTPSAGNRIYNGMGTQTVYTSTTYATQYFKIFAVDSFGQESSTPLTGNAAPNSPFVFDTTSPNVPSFTSGTITNYPDGKGASAALAWTITTPPSDMAGYKIRYRKAGSSDTYIESSYSKDVTSGVIELPLAYQNYEFQIRSHDWSANYSAWSANYTVTSAGAGTPSTVTGVVSTPQPGGIRYTWDAVPELNISYYEVQVSTSSTFASGNITFNAGKALTLTVNGLAASTLYYARIRAFNVAGTAGGYSSTDTDTTQSYNGTITAVSADIITPGTLGTAGSGVINIGAGATLKMNGGALVSNTYGGNVYNAGATSGFFIDDTHVHIPAGQISASALVTGTISGTNTITMSGPNAKIVGTGFDLSGSGLNVTSGTIAAAALQIQDGFNMLPAAYADFESTPAFYATSFHNNCTSQIVTGSAKFNKQNILITRGATAAGWIYYLSTNNLLFNYDVVAGDKMILSFYARNQTAVSTTVWMGQKYDVGATTTTATYTPTPGSAVWTRYQYPITVPAGATRSLIFFQTSTTTAGASMEIDGVQVERQQAGLNTASPWKPPSTTTIDGGFIRTGAIISNATATVTNVIPVFDATGTAVGTTTTEVTDPTGRPAFSLDLDGTMDISRLSVRGNVVVGHPLSGGPDSTYGATITAGITSGSPNVTSAAGVFTSNDPGKAITGTGIPAATTIVSVNAGGSGAVISANATVTNASAALTVTRDMTVVSTLSSTNYVKGTQGWSIRSDGIAEFQDVVSDSIHGSAIKAGTLQAESLISGTVDADLVLAGTIQTASTPTNLQLTFTSGSTTVTTPGVDVQFLNPTDIGLYITGPGIPPDTKITAIASTTSATISKVTTAAGTLVDGQLFRGRRVTMSGVGGIALEDQYRNPVVTLPTDPSQSATFYGSISATDLFVNDEFRMFGINNSLGPGSQLSLSSGSYVPGIPKVTFDWPYINMSNYGGGSYVPSTDTYFTNVRGGNYDFATDHYYCTFTFYGGYVQRWWGSGIKDFAIQVNKAFYSPNADQMLGGMWLDANYAAFLTKDITTNIWRQQYITRANFLKSGGPVAGDLVSQYPWNQATDSYGMAGTPIMARYGTSTFVAKRGSDNKLVLYRYSTNNLTTAPANTLKSGYLVSGNIMSMVIGKFDMGPEVYAVITCSGSGSYRQTYIFKVADSTGVLGSAFTTNSGYQFPLPYGESPIMTTWKGTTPDDSAGKFQTLTFNGKIADHTNMVPYSATQSVYKVSMRWRNDGTNPIVGSTGGSAALGISTESNVGGINVVKRSRVTITYPSNIPDTGGDSPNSVVYYLGVDSGTRFRYDELPKGVKTQVISTLRTTNASGTVLALKGGTASQIYTANGTSITGDGLVLSGANPYLGLQGGTQNIPDSVWTKISLSSETKWPVNTRGNIQGVSSAILVQVSGFYMISGSVGYPSGSTGRRYIAAEIVSDPNSVVTATSTWNVAFETGFAATGGFRSAASGICYVSAGQHIRLVVFQDSGATQAITPGYTWLRAYMLA